MTNPHAKTAAATFLTERMRDLKHRKFQKEIAQEAGFLNANSNRPASLPCRR